MSEEYRTADETAADSMRTASEPTETTTSSTPKPMTDSTTDATGRTDDQTTSTDERTTTDGRSTGSDTESAVPFPPECRQSMKDMDHSPPVEGANRTFERGTGTRDVSE